MAARDPERPAPDPAGEKRPPRAARALAGPLRPGRDQGNRCALAKARAFAKEARQEVPESAPYTSTATLPIGCEQQARIQPSATSSSEMPPLWTMWTSPSVLRTLQVPQRPKVQPEGMFSPARFATASTVSVSPQGTVRPDRVKAISAAAPSAGVTSASTGASASLLTGAPKLSWW